MLFRSALIPSYSDIFSLTLVIGLLLLFMPCERFCLAPIPVICTNDPLMLHFLYWLLLQITKCFRTGGPVFQQIFLRLKQDVVFVPFDYQPETGYLSLYSIQQLLWLTYISGEGNGYPLQYSCLENPMDGGAWRATVHGAARVRHDLAIKPPPPPPSSAEPQILNR